MSDPTRRPGELPPLPQARAVTSANAPAGSDSRAAAGGSVTHEAAPPPRAPLPARPAPAPRPASAVAPGAPAAAPPPAAAAAGPLGALRPKRAADAPTGLTPTGPAPAAASTTDAADAPRAPRPAPLAGASSVPAQGALDAPGPLVPADPMLGEVLSGRYRIVEVIGSGGMATVYRAQHELLKKPVAIKLLHPELAIDDAMAARFEREAIAAARLDHPNCISITDFGRTEHGRMFLVMEYLEGTPLSDVAGHGTRLPWERAVDLARQILRGLARAHDMGIVHRDLKPSNVILVRHAGGRDLAKIIDFGIAKIFDGSHTGPHVETQAGIVFGTADFLAPERLLGHSDADPRSDVYSVGILLYEMLAGDRPFRDDDPYVIVKRTLTEAPRPLSEVAPDAGIPPALEQAVFRALEKDPASRYQTARDFLASLDVLGRKNPITSGYLAGAAESIGSRIEPTAGSPAAEEPAMNVDPTPPAAPATEPPPAAAVSPVAPPPQARPRWGRIALLAALPLVVVGAVLVAVGDRSTPPLAPVLPPATGLATSEPTDIDAEVTQLMKQAGEGDTVEARHAAFDRLVALGYGDRVPWLPMLVRDLEQLPTCEARRETVVKLRRLRNPEALPHVQKAATRADNGCLQDEAKRAASALGGATPAAAGSETTAPSRGSSTRRSGRSGRGHF